MQAVQFNNRFIQTPNFTNKNKTASLSFIGLSPSPQNRETVHRIVDEIRKAQNIGIIMHRNPDRDATSSAQTVRDFASTQPNIRRADILIEESEIPGELTSLKGAGLVDLKVQKPTCNYDLAISVDCAEKKLMSPKAKKIFEDTPSTIKIDHHPVRTEHPEDSYYADINLIDTSVCSASQLTIQLANPLNVELKPETAAAIYSGMLTDSGGFRFLNDPVQVFEDSAILAKTGINASELYRENIDRMTSPQFELYRNTLNDVKLSDNADDVACLIIDKANRPEGITNQQYDQVTGSIVGTVLPNIEGVKVVVAYDKTSGETNLRSASVSVNDIAEAFGGGGHKFASGCSVKGKLPELLEFVEKKLSND